MATLCLLHTDMSKYKLQHHQIIESALNNFDADFFCTNNIIFGGGTRIALELDEYRESVDIDFLCPNKSSYRSVRGSVDNTQLNQLVNTEFEYVREIRSDRDAVRTVIKHASENIKLEFVSFADYDLSFEYDKEKFAVPFLDKQSCFYTKLLANSDRKLQEPYKDIFDILAMYRAWGSIPEKAIESAEEYYSKRAIIPDLIKALQDIVEHQNKYFKAAKNVKMKEDWANDLINIQAAKLLEEMKIIIASRE
ncbi:nucleotidyl transferase AbiEii/AbiGii toxin family protein [Vibrio halioticoli]|nr:nucleotidyl transferase AbiEii/AbiGii toxin family protein [Vibrio halioticoli]